MSTSSWWNSSTWKKKQKHVLLRKQVRLAICDYFDRQKFSEVETPILQISPGLEPHLTAFATQLENLSGKKIIPLYLHTSPEFTMKKLLSAGAGNIYQFARTFRNREGSATHHPEFVMLEWYRVNTNYTKIMEDSINVIRAATEFASRKVLRWQGKKSNPYLEWKKISVVDAFREYAKIDLNRSIEDGLHPNQKIFQEDAKNIGISTQKNDTWDDIFFRIFLERIEPALGEGIPCILFDYPACMAALSLRKKSDPRFSERFEIYICGLELANAFSELTDANEQRARFESDMQKKQNIYGFRYPIDEDFLDALNVMPMASGIALGFDRLMMLVTGVSHIEDILWAPTHIYR